MFQISVSAIWKKKSLIMINIIMSSKNTKPKDIDSNVNFTQSIEIEQAKNSGKCDETNVRDNDHLASDEQTHNASEDESPPKPVPKRTKYDKQENGINNNDDTMDVCDVLTPIESTRYDNNKTKMTDLDVNDYSIISAVNTT
ncbi:hypothetical protein SNE40_013559 [Patella caerulea]|uniref:Uncharacterized protein n=1 Tax=Patella caerulea TaxID=87958 RepID=A0AAN8PB28_PATCE